MNARKLGYREALKEILRRWRKYLLILLPTVGMAFVIGIALEAWWVPAMTIPILLAPFVVALCLMNVKPIDNPWCLIYQGPLEYSRFIRDALAHEEIASWDPADHERGRGVGSGGHLECALHVDRAKVESAQKIVRRLIEERPELFQEPPARV